MNFCDMVKNKFGKSVKKIRSDNGMEFCSDSMLKFYVENRILHEMSYVNTPKKNGRVERKHRHILEVACAL